MWQSFFIFVISSVSIFLIFLILMQRGKGGGLAGAFGGMGGQSAFGAKAGDVFTRATIVVVSIWFLFCIVSILILNSTKTSGGLTGGLSNEPVNATSSDATGTKTPANTNSNVTTPTPAVPQTPANP
ncbi:MAG: preprotein translocase subunit SecG [Planctomycetaceae bacterium]|jgi:preprotein translocase subunit SecG|nr:preprotein translocase subunit SecG [Planctomycetaceae bacterium]